MHDIVYVLRNDVKPDELRYSLRSIVRNFEFRKVVFYGGCPEGFRPDRWVEIIQEGSSKFVRTRSMYETIFNDEELTPDFYLFNDDFFIMRPYEQDVPRINGTLLAHAERIRRRHNRVSAYSNKLIEASRWLIGKGYDALSYENHAPLLINREKALTFKNNVRFPFKSLYGNINSIGGAIIPDCKIVEFDRLPPDDVDVVSTSDKSFSRGEVGRFIEASFTRKCRFEEK